MIMTTLESILSNLIHVPVKLVDVNLPEAIEMRCGEVPALKFGLTAVIDPGAKKQDVYVPDDEIPFCDLDCDCCGSCGHLFYDEDAFDDEPPVWGIPDVDRVIFSPPATIVFWTDGTKTVVKAMEGEKYEKYAGFAMACMKKLFGSTSRAKAIMAECEEDQTPKPKEEPKKEKPTLSYNPNIDWDMIVKALFNVSLGGNKKEKKDETPTE